MLLNKWTGQDYSITLEKNPVSCDYCDYWDFYVRCVLYGDEFTVPFTDIKMRKEIFIHKHFKNQKNAMDFISQYIC